MQSIRLAGVILAGGRSSRMGASKALARLGGVPLAEHVYRRIAAQTEPVIINANTDRQALSALGIPVVPDGLGGYPGPLAGVLAGMKWAHEQTPPFSHILTVAVDTPFFPRDLAARLSAAALRAPEQIVVAASGGRVHPTFSIWPAAQRETLQLWLMEPSNRRVMDWIGSQPYQVVNFEMSGDNETMLDPFFNVNNPDDLRRAEQEWSERHG